jgi:hypothetical protein
MRCLLPLRSATRPSDLFGWRGVKWLQCVHAIAFGRGRYPKNPGIYPTIIALLRSGKGFRDDSRILFAKSCVEKIAPPEDTKSGFACTASKAAFCIFKVTLAYL